MSDESELDQSSSPSRHRYSIRGRVGGVLRGISEPTQKIAVPGSDDALTQRHARGVIDLCLRVGEALLATGASASDVVAIVLRISKAYGLTSTHVDVSFTSITISVHRGLDEDPISVMRVVRVRTTDFTRSQNVLRLVDSITEPEIPLDIDEARSQLGDILVRPHPYRRWVVTAGRTILAAGVVTMYDAGLALIFVAATTAAVVDISIRQLGKWGISAFFGQIVAASISTWVAVLLYWLNSVGIELPGANRPTLIVISGIIMLLSGMALTSAARDAIDGYYVTATARGMEVVMLTLGLAIGISVSLGLAISFGVPMRVGTSLGPDGGLFLGIVGASIIGIGFALSSYAEPKVVAFAAVAAGAVFALHQLLSPLTTQPGVIPGLAGAAAGALGYLAYRWLKAPEAAITMAGMISLLPGLAVYRAIYAFIDSEHGIIAALPSFVSAGATGIGLAAGITIGGYIARRNFGLDRAAELASRRSRGMK